MRKIQERLFMRHIAIESGAYVVSVPQFIPRSAFPDDFPLALPEAEVIGNGGAAIIDPEWGDVVAGPLYGEEGMPISAPSQCERVNGISMRRWSGSVNRNCRSGSK